MDLMLRLRINLSSGCTQVLFWKLSGSTFISILVQHPSLPVSEVKAVGVATDLVQFEIESYLTIGMVLVQFIFFDKLVRYCRTQMVELKWFYKIRSNIKLKLYCMMHVAILAKPKRDCLDLCRSHIYRDSVCYITIFSRSLFVLSYPVFFSILQSYSYC